MTGTAAWGESLLAGTWLGVGLSVAALRALPVLLAFHGHERAPRHQKVIALSAYLGLLYLAVRYADFVLTQVLIAYALLAAVSIVPYCLRGRLSRGAMLAVVLCAFVVMPAIALPAPGLCLLLGWDLVMSTYSFCVDAPHVRSPARRFAFFVFVDPTLVYSRRGARVAEPGFCAAGATRAALGLLSIVCSAGVDATAGVVAPWLHETVADVPMAGLRLVSLYLAHTGLASLQLGLMRQLGYVVPERYQRPLRSRSPAEFWQRWNTYVGGWARLYVFVPLVRALSRSAPQRRLRRPMLVRAVAVVTTFVAIGALHDAYATALQREVMTDMTVWFALNGLALVVWAAAGRTLERAAARSAVRTTVQAVTAAAFAVASATLLP